MHEKNKGQEYSVGYKKPPRHTQFEPGKSGNPNGRPKKEETLTAIFSKQLRARVSLLKEGRRQTISMLDAIVRRYLNKAAAGDIRAAAFIFNFVKESNSGNGDSLSDVVQEFRALYARQQASDCDQHEISEREVDGEETV